MRHLRVPLSGLLLVSMITLAPPSSLAQPKGPRRPPPLSPMATQALTVPIGGNYFNIVMPTLELRTMQARQEAEISNLQKTLQGVQGTLTPSGELEFTLHTTGHRVYRNHTSHYYPLLTGARR